MQGQYNMRSPAVKRLMKEAHELKDATELYYAQPLDDNLFEWHFTLRGPEDSDFDGGTYHGRIILPPDYPMKPPSIILLTPNGRFETNKKICLSISGHHPESWQPSWSIRTALLAIIGFMPTHGGGAIGSLDYTPEERKVLAKKSQDWKCPDCGDVSCKLRPLTEASEKVSKEAKELATQINFSGEKSAKSETSSSGGGQSSSTPASTGTSTSTSGNTNNTPGPFSPLPPGAQFAWTPAGIGASPVTVPRFPYPPYSVLPNFSTPYGQRGTNGGALQMPFMPPMPFFPPFMGGVPPFPHAPCSQASPSQSQPMSQVSSQTLHRPSDQPAGAVSSSSAVNTSSLNCPAVSSSVATVSASAPGMASVLPSAPAPSSVGQAGSKGSASIAESLSGASASGAEAPPTSTSMTSSNTNVSTASSATPSATELRQRQAQPASPSSHPAVRAGAAQGNASVSQQNADGTASLIVMILLGVAITLLLIRRLCMHCLSPDLQDTFDDR